MLCTSGLVDDVTFAHTVMTRNRRQERNILKLTPGGSKALTPWRTLKVNHQGSAPDRRPSLTSTTALLRQILRPLHQTVKSMHKR